jgi:DNA-binding NarL/FixJ family response regulator
MAACRAAGRAGMNKTDPQGMGSAESLASPSEADQGLGPALPKVAFVDDDPDLLDGLRRSLHRLNLGWSVSFYQDPSVALAALREAPVDVVVLDIRMPEMNGVTLAGRLAVECPQTLSIVLSGSTDFDVAISSINVGRIFRYLIKPCPTPTLVSAVKAAVRSRSAAASSNDQAVSAKAAVDLLKSGVIVLGPRGQVLFTNQRAGSLLSRNDGLIIDNSGICRSSDTEDTRRLHRSVRAARDEGVADALTLQTQRHGPLRIVVRSGEDEGDAGPVTCLYLFAEDDDPAIDPHLLRGMFGLTPSESRLAAALASGLSLEATAEREGWTLSSARSYLKTVFEKVGVTRQADLVRVVLKNTGQ